MDSSQQSTYHLLCSILFISSFRRWFHASALGEFLYEINNIFGFLHDQEIFQSYSQGQLINMILREKQDECNRDEMKHNILKKTLSRLIFPYLDLPDVF